MCIEEMKQSHEVCTLTYGEDFTIFQAYHPFSVKFKKGSLKRRFRWKGEVSVGNRLKKLKTRLLAIPLAIGMLGLGLALPQTSLVANATGTPTNDNGGTSSGGLAGSSSLSTAWNNSEQGYRFYIVDQGYNCVSNVYDYVYSTPVGVTKKLTATRGKAWNSGGSVSGGTFTQLQSECQASTPPNPPYLGNGRAGGSEFRAWFLGGAAGTLVHGSSTAPWTSDIYMSYQNSQITARRQGPGPGSTDGGGGGGSTGGWQKPTVPHTPCVCSRIATYMAATPPSTSSATSDLNSLSALDIAIAQGLARACAGAASAVDGIYSCSQYDLCINGAIKSVMRERAAASALGSQSNTALGRVAYAIFKGKISESYANSVKANKIAASHSGGGVYGALFGSADKSQRDPNAYSTAQVPTASGESPAYNYLNQKGFWNVPGFDSGLNALMELDGAGNNLYYLVVEPITWVAVANGSGVAVAPGKVYGTIYDILAYYASNYPAIGNGYYPAIFAYMLNKWGKAYTFLFLLPENCAISWQMTGACHKP